MAGEEAARQWLARLRRTGGADAIATTKGLIGFCRIGRSGGRGLSNGRASVAIISGETRCDCLHLLREKRAQVAGLLTTDSGRASYARRFLKRFAKRNAYKFGGVVLGIQ